MYLSNKPLLFIYVLVFSTFIFWTRTAAVVTNNGNKNINKNLKYVLYWTPIKWYPFHYWGNGQEGFIKRKCPVTTCYMTTDRNFFGGDLTKFDAIAFNGRFVVETDLPHNRSIHQKYIYYNLEPPDRYSTCKASYDGFYNWTITYKLHSDIPYTYILIKDKSTGEIIGPKANMQWAENLPDLNEDFNEKIANKTKLAAWFVSRCKSQSKREDYVKELNSAAQTYGYQVDIYGKCGTLSCPRKNFRHCDKLLRRDYYFYLSFENSFDEDYVTEKLLRALNDDLIPVVYGGADYSRFLPPGSYIDARKYTPTELAALMVEIVSSPQRYRDFFKWQSRYEYSDPLQSKDICDVCAALNNENKMAAVTEYKELRKWWHGSNLKKTCRLK